MKYFRSILAAVITLSLVAGFSSIQTKKTVSAAVKNKNITIKVTADYTLKIPAVWKGKYVFKKWKDENRDSYVNSYVYFYAKKIHKQTGEGLLFGIERYKDDTYMDLPSFELVGRWNGMNYVAVYPTETQTLGATKAAKKQYNKLTPASYETPFTIMPVKRTGKNIYRAGDFSLKLPASWKGKYTVKKTGKNKKNSYVAFFAKKCYNEHKLGWLFSIVKYDDESYKELPAYEVVGKWNGVSYVAVFPTDVQSEGVTEKASKQYYALNKSVEKVVRSIAG